ncbi:hypothetical protein [Gordonia sp. NB41Y]|uniref:hypothetical protein n=1 Tax=Gordonia sp. NB41Y TaxID=875808 RepID=UPI0006B23786|nr:hypothetical protein [Gordonia sp. NB41Y]WLP90510.1 hypothetical protein Q9K23_23930 [Gordonia sp. NB41Y]
MDQTEQRERRRRHVPVEYGDAFSLAAEVREITGPLAEQIVAAPAPATFRLSVDRLAAEVEATVWVATQMLAESDAARRTRHIERVEDRQRATTILGAQVQRPAAPVISTADVVGGTWSALLTGYAEQVDADLAALLGRAVRPGQTRGRLSASERLVEALRGVDREGCAIERKLARPIETTRPATPSGLSAADELRALGVEL